MTIQNQRSPINPAPLAFGAFAMATFLLSCVNAGFIGVGFIPVVVAVAWFFGGFTQVIVSIWEIAHDRLFPAVVFGSYGAFWVSFAILQTFYVGKIPASMAGAANALFLGVWCIVTIYFLVGSFRTNLALVIAFILVEVMLIPLTIGFANGSHGATVFGGWAGIVLALEVWYIAGAELINHQFGRIVLPLGQLNQPASTDTLQPPAIAGDGFPAGQSLE